MKKFNFKLQKVLEYRAMLEKWAKEAYLDARSTRLESEEEIRRIAELREEALGWSIQTIEHLQTVELQLKKLDQKEIEQRVVVNVLLHEEERAHQEWTEKRIELEALNKVYERQYEEWRHEVDRQMQIELDEWAVRRRAA